jgi:hypothetical protein
MYIIPYVESTVCSNNDYLKISACLLRNYTYTV